MAVKVVSLTVHKNNLDQRRRHETSRFLRRVVKIHTSRKDKAGFALVSWDEDQDAEVDFSIGGEVSTNSLPDFVRGALARRINMMDSE